MSSAFSSKLTACPGQSRAVNMAAEQATDASVRCAPRLTEDSLPVTLPKDADKPLEGSAAGEQIHSSSPVEDKPVSAGVLDLQLVPQVHLICCQQYRPILTKNLCVFNAVTRAANQASAATAAASTEGCRAAFSTVSEVCTCLF